MGVCQCHHRYILALGRHVVRQSLFNRCETTLAVFQENESLRLALFDDFPFDVQISFLDRSQIKVDELCLLIDYEKVFCTPTVEVVQGVFTGCPLHARKHGVEQRLVKLV